MRNLRVGLVLVLCLSWAGAGWADNNNNGGGNSAAVPRTGQVICYDTVGAVIPCAGTGQDGDLRQGVRLPKPRFKDNGDGTVKDKLTGLTWLKNFNCIESMNPLFDTDDTAGDGRVTWQHALDFVAGINSGAYDCGDTSGRHGGHRTDWRLPNVRELYSLVNHGFSAPAMSNRAGTGQATEGNPFTNIENLIEGFVFGGFYWSSTSITPPADDAITANFAWDVDLTFGFMGLGVFIGSADKSVPFSLVLAVRGDSQDDDHDHDHD